MTKPKLELCVEQWSERKHEFTPIAIPENGEIPPTAKPVWRVNYGTPSETVKEEEININQATLNGYLVFEYTCRVCGLTSSRIIRDGEQIIGFFCIDENCRAQEDEDSLELIYNTKKVDVSKYETRW